MRSRYHACVMGIEHYLPASWHRSTRPPSVDGDCALHWLGLEIRRQGKLVGQPRPADDQSNATQGESPASAR
ncbi:MAG TPA: YchJ family metal-binding protein [Accumulibacter sp.]|uniref:YchJ family metal-binding protein n=1 Tax=Accumulibacter sp. TaxID=2053492 RepID=UPI0025EA7442|nr:YchJ family metal-binding protein [Accumulibacter sp.]MCM8597651.1 YchJ family metal-binding protein [Accumulibacter sp.]MCM8664143.1 YchJ family metal-binding protein [Accumulibacter sp.]HNC53526.1 YchJ family metal-binding protein [Accumulibacter sp.]